MYFHSLSTGEAGQVWMWMIFTARQCWNEKIDKTLKKNEWIPTALPQAFTAKGLFYALRMGPEGPRVHNWSPYRQAKDARCGGHTSAPTVNLCWRPDESSPCMVSLSALPLFSSLLPPLDLSPTPDNEERGPVVKSYLKKILSSESV